jgi:hypothetical protein
MMRAMHGQWSSDSAFRGGVFRFVVLLGILSSVYFTALVLPYGYLDDYSWFYDFHYHARGVFRELASQGRPLNEPILGAAFRHIWTIGEMWRIRAITLVELAGMAWLFHYAILLNGWRRGTFPFAVMLCAVPAVQVYAAWATCVPIPVGGICAIAAGIVAKSAVGDLRGRWRAALASAILLLAAGTIYQPAMMLFWPTIALDLFAPGRAEFRRAARLMLDYLCIAGCAIFCAWVVFKWGVHEYPRMVHPDRTGFAPDFSDKIIWFLTTPLVDCLNFPKLFPNPQFAVGVSILICIGLLAYCAGGAGRLGLLLIAALMLPLAYLPNLVAKPDWASYRAQIGLSWLVLVYSWLAIHGYWRIARAAFIPKGMTETLSLPLFAVAAAACAATAAFQSTTYITWPQTIELASLKTLLGNPGVDDAQSIVLIKPSYLDTPTRLWRYDEFGSPSLAQWTGATEIFLIRKEKDPNGRAIPVEVREPDRANGPIPVKSVLLDMRSIRLAGR